jgi:hypothetical protein
MRTANYVSSQAHVYVMRHIKVCGYSIRAALVVTRFARSLRGADVVAGCSVVCLRHCLPALNAPGFWLWPL